MKQFSIAILVGSIRKESLNRKLANALIALAPEHISFHFVQIDDLPLYNDDLLNSLPPPVLRMKSDLRVVHGVIIVSPEYNRSIPAPLKNALDWGSRPPSDNVWAGKPAGVIGISPGPSGTALAQQHLRNVLTCLDAPTMQRPEAFLRMTEGFFNADGSIGEGHRAFLQRWLDTYAAWVLRFAQ